MASGVEHRAATKRNLKWLAVPSLVMIAYEPLAVGFPLGLVIGHILTPDIDHHWTTIEELRMKHYSRILGGVWSLYWWPYQRFHSHRGKSHTPFLGTLGRFLYLLWWPLVLTASWGMGVWLFWLFVFAGMCAQDLTHLRLDRRQYGSKKETGKKSRTRERYGRNGRHRRNKDYRSTTVEPCYVPIRSPCMHAYFSGGNKGSDESKGGEK